MPAEWEPHEATWISWPHPDGASFPSAYERVVPVFVEMVKALRASEIVRINVRDAAQETEVRALLNDCPLERVEFFQFRRTSHGAATTVRSSLNARRIRESSAVKLRIQRVGVQALSV